MSSADATTRWARAVAEELVRAGLRDVVVAPGSRSTPLVMAFAADERVRCRVHLDERSGAFFALGLGKASRRPAAIVTTSGTATANVFPAVVEAAQGETPLLVLTADRPHRLRDSDANQAIDQLRLFGPFTRAFFDLAPPVSEGPALRHLRGVAARAHAVALGSPAGPVHLNFPFDKPLEPEEDHTGFADEQPLAARGRPGGEVFVRIDAGRRAAPPEALESLLAALDTPRGVIVAGPSPEAGRLGPAVWRLAAATGFPLLADALSGARFGVPSDVASGRAAVGVVGGYDLFLRDPAIRELLAPSLVVRVGASPTSAALQAWLGEHDGVEHVVIDADGRWKDHGATATHYVRADAADTLDALTELASPAGDHAWFGRWHAADSAARIALDQVEDRDYEGEIARIVADGAPEGANLFVSSSMPVRDVDAFGLPRRAALAAYGNRGASGIDGIVSTAFGVAAASGAPTVCLIGDIAFFHDQNGLLWGREEDAEVVFVLVDNDGGGIFHRLPIADHDPDFTRYFATPHGLDLRHAAEMHGIAFADTTVAGLLDALRAAHETGGTRVLRVKTDRALNTRKQRGVVDAVIRSVRDALG